MSRSIIIIVTAIVLGSIAVLSLIVGGFFNQGLPDYGPAPYLQLQNQDNQTVTMANFTGKVVVINFIYTLCTDPNFCPLSTFQMYELQTILLNDGYNASQFQLLTISFDWVHDNATTMKSYGENYSAIFADWSFLSGSLPQINQSMYAFTCNDAYTDNLQLPNGTIVNQTYGYLPDCIPQDLQPKLAPNNVPAYNVFIAWDYSPLIKDFLHYSTPLVVIDQKGHIRVLENNYAFKDYVTGDVVTTDQWNPTTIAKDVESLIKA